MDLYKVLKEKVKVPIIAGIGTNSTSDTIENGRDAISCGVDGLLIVAGHIVSSKMKEMMDSFLEGNVVRAAEIHLELLNINQNLFMVTNPIPIKAALNMMGVKVGGLRLPLTTAKPAVKGEIQKGMRELGLV